jgi:hypothetical protein
MRRIHRAMLRGTLAAVVASGIVVLASSGSASGALPAVCTSGAPNVRTFTGSISTSWENSGNWSPASIPDASNAIACIPANKTVTGVSFRTVNQLHVDSGSVVDIPPGNVLFFDGTTTLAQLTGPGRLDVRGTAQVDGGLSMRSAVRMTILSAGTTSVESDSFITADWGTITIIDPNGLLRLNGDGGYYQGSPVAGQPLSHIGNHGTLEKASGSGTSVIDAWYAQAPGASIEVNCCGTLALPDATAVGAQVVPNMSFATALCGPGTTSLCQGSQNPAIDPSSVALHIPSANSQTAGVTLQELVQPPDTTDSRAIGNEVYAHADQLDPDPANPAQLTLRFSQADVMTTPLAEVQVGHISDAGVMAKTPDCISGTIPPGAPYCVVRPVTRDAQNTFVTVLTTQTSRWRLRRQLPGEGFDQTAPGAARDLVAKLASADGSKVALSWTAPTSDGGASVTTYQVFRDGQLVFANDGSTSAVVSDPGPGKHTFSVAAVNSIGAGAQVGAAITIDQLSKPRKVKPVQGKKGGKLTAGARWKAPADAGGFAIRKYKVAVFEADGTKVDTEVVKADELKLLFKLKPGKYFLKVKARNSDRWGPWSKKTDLVRPR